MLESEGLVKNHITYMKHINTVMPHGHHIYFKESDMAKTTMCKYPQSAHALPHWKCVLRCCVEFPCNNLPEK